MESFAWFEATALNVWVRELPLVFPTILIAHALGMGAVVGVNVAIALKLCKAVGARCQRGKAHGAAHRCGMRCDLVVRMGGSHRLRPADHVLSASGALVSLVQSVMAR